MKLRKKSLEKEIKELEESLKQSKANKKERRKKWMIK